MTRCLQHRRRHDTLNTHVHNDLHFDFQIYAILRHPAKSADVKSTCVGIICPEISDAKIVLLRKVERQKSYNHIQAIVNTCNKTVTHIPVSLPCTLDLKSCFVRDTSCFPRRVHSGQRRT